MKRVRFIKSFKFKLLIAFVVFVILFLINIVYQNTNILISYVSFESSRVPDAFDGYVICHITDLHDATFGDNQSKLIAKVKSGNPDIVVITGDIIDSNRYDLENSMDFVNGIVSLAPIYYVSGNHEYATYDYDNIKNELISAGVIVLENEVEDITIGDDVIKLIGIDDLLAFEVSPYVDAKSDVNFVLNGLSDSNHFKILLAHRPELFDVYSDNNIDLVFSGHAHGGQVRLPFLEGIFAPGQGILPEYSAGFYTNNGTTMYLSRGLGNSTFPLRVFNNPEVVFLTLESN